MFLNSGLVCFLKSTHRMIRLISIALTVINLQFRKDLINGKMKSWIFILLLHIFDMCKTRPMCSNPKFSSSLYLLPVISVSTSVETNSCWSCSLPSSYTNPRPFEATSWLSSTRKSDKVILLLKKFVYRPSSWKF